MRARNIVTLALAGSAVLALSACGGAKQGDGNDQLVTEMGNIGLAEGTISDNMTAIDGATMGNDAMLAPDSAPTNSSDGE